MIYSLALKLRYTYTPWRETLDISIHLSQCRFPKETPKTQVAIAACNALGFIFVYFGVFGWAACVLGIVAASMACCVCCQCCNAKMDTEVTVVQQTPVMPIAVGQPVGPA